MEPGTYYDVHFHDEWLGIDDFETIRADDEDEAESEFWESHDESDVSITEVDQVMNIPDIERIHA